MRPYQRRARFETVAALASVPESELGATSCAFDEMCSDWIPGGGNPVPLTWTMLLVPLLSVVAGITIMIVLLTRSG
jgi:hypothetical protein